MSVSWCPWNQLIELEITVTFLICIIIWEPNISENQSLEKSRSAKNHRKTSGPIKPEHFFSRLTLKKKTDLDFSRPWFSEKSRCRFKGHVLLYWSLYGIPSKRNIISPSFKSKVFNFESDYGNSSIFNVLKLHKCTLNVRILMTISTEVLR